MLNVCVSATSTDEKLAITSDLREYLNSTDTARDTAQATAIKAASRWAERQVGQPLLAQVYSETVAGFGGRRLLLARTPILKVFRFFDSTSTGTATEICSSQFRVLAEEGMLERDAGFEWRTALQQDLVPNIIPGEEARPWLVEYSAGYRFPGSSSTEYGTTDTGQETLPADIKQAVIIKAAQIFERQGGVRMEAVGDYRINYGSEADDPALALLAPYRRVF